MTFVFRKLRHIENEDSRPLSPNGDSFIILWNFHVYKFVVIFYFRFIRLFCLTENYILGLNRYVLPINFILCCLNDSKAINKNNRIIIVTQEFDVLHLVLITFKSIVIEDGIVWVWYIKIFPIDISKPIFFTKCTRGSFR